MRGFSIFAKKERSVRRRWLPPFVRAFARDKRGNILALTAVVLPVLLATFGLGVEGAHWYQAKRSMQNAADSAAIAAASNGSASYATEGKAVAAQYGLQHGVNGVTVTMSNSATCPSGGNSCYSATISMSMPLLLSQLVGYTGDTLVSGKPAKLISATAIAQQGTTSRNYCILALASSGAAEGIRTNGSPKADLSGCDVMSNTDAQCNGHNLNAGYGDAHGTSSDCGADQTSGVPIVSDSYASLASNIPPVTCTGTPQYPQAPAKKKDPDPRTQLTGTLYLSGNVTYCGSVVLTGDVTLSNAGSLPAVIIIKNGHLDTNGFTIRTTSGSAATIIFTGDNTAGYTHAPIGGGTIDIAAPTSGTWSGVAMYQDPALTTGVDITEAGNSPTWNITGLVYLPHSSVTFSGAVNKSSNGLSCFTMVVDNITINGTGSILAQGQCAQAGLTMPTGNIPARGKLVL